MPVTLSATSVAISGDTVVVGARSSPATPPGLTATRPITALASAGAAYVFVRNGTTWSQQAYLKASNTEASDSFGVFGGGLRRHRGRRRVGESSNATGINGDQTDNSALGAGAAYVFVRNGTTWSQQAYLKASNTDANDAFGMSVAVSGDTVVVGAVCRVQQRHRD